MPQEFYEGLSARVMDNLVLLRLDASELGRLAGIY